jgi:U3 small nucleolar RNA-associated protein 11
MSSLRNAVKRITHKERSQPRNRQHLGILEKKKDYKKRAEDYHKKEDRIKAMQERAAMRNPDEFYFGMKTSKVKDGKHKSLSVEEARKLPPEMIKLMKDQDLSYVRMQKQKDTKRAERLQASLHMIETGREDNRGVKRKHTVFVGSQDEAKEFDVAKHFDTLPEFAGRTFNRLRSNDVEKLAKASKTHVDEYGDEKLPTAEEMAQKAKIQRKLARTIAKARSSAYGEMEARLNRAQVMQKAESYLVTEKLVAGKGRRRKIQAAENGQPAQYKWRRERKR